MSVDPIRAEAKAVEEGAHAVLCEDGSFSVRSASRPGVGWRVTFEALMKGGRWYLRLNCTCEAGMARPSELVPCWHSALVARRLEREGWATWEDGSWRPTDEALRNVRRVPPPADGHMDPGATGRYASRDEGGTP